MIVLIGYRGCGKTTVGPIVAARLDWRFVDADVVLEERAGKTITEIFRDDGEQAFRDLESQNLRDLLEVGRVAALGHPPHGDMPMPGGLPKAATRPTVLATGGGVILREDNRTLIHSNSFAVWLDCDASTCWSRIQKDTTTAQRRPNLAGGGFVEVERLLTERRPLYEATAHLRVDGSLSPDAVADCILQGWTARARE